VLHAELTPDKIHVRPLERHNLPRPKTRFARQQRDEVSAVVNAAPGFHELLELDEVVEPRVTSHYR
jgi:hypothetical protein